VRSIKVLAIDGGGAAAVFGTVFHTRQIFSRQSMALAASFLYSGPSFLGLLSPIARIALKHCNAEKRISIDRRSAE
jgi:hypothetical protein